MGARRRAPTTSRGSRPVACRLGRHIILASLATRRLKTQAQRIRGYEHSHQETLGEIEQLQTQNAMLEIIARSVDATLAFQALASRIARLVPCDRVGLALLTENGQEFQTYTARVQEEERRARPRPEVVFKVDQTILGSVVRSREALIVPDISVAAPDFLDANILHSSGFGSAMIVRSSRTRGRPLNLVQQASAPTARARRGDPADPEIFAVAVIAQQLQLSLGKYRSMEAMSDLTLSIATEINSALQTIIGHCDLLERGYPDPNLQRDLATVVRQAQRIEELLSKMRHAAHERPRSGRRRRHAGRHPSARKAAPTRRPTLIVEGFAPQTPLIRGARSRPRAARRRY